MIQAILIDDEPNALEVLRLLLAQYCTDVTVLACCASGEAGIEAINRLHPDLVFLDIEMPQKNGFDVLAETAQHRYQVIFTTAYDQFAIKAFKVSAVDYLLKPIDILELQAAVQKVRTRSDYEDLEIRMHQLRRELGLSLKPVERVAIPVGGAIHVWPTDDIVRCESDSNYTHVYLREGKKITLSKTLKEVEENLGGSQFFRLHQSHLVNLNHIRRIVRGEHSYAVMTDGEKVPVSRQKKEAFLSAFYRL